MHEDIQNALEAVLDAKWGHVDWRKFQIEDRHREMNAAMRDARVFHRALRDWQQGEDGLIWTPSRIVGELQP